VTVHVDKLGADIIVHAVAALVVVVVACFVYGYIRRSRRALVELIDIFRHAVDVAVVEREADRAALGRVLRNVETGVAGVARLEAAGVLVADDLAASHRRADETDQTEPAGAAADAASRQTPAEQERP